MKDIAFEVATSLSTYVDCKYKFPFFSSNYFVVMTYVNEVKCNNLTKGIEFLRGASLIKSCYSVRCFSKTLC